MARKLDSGEKHFLRLIAQGQKRSGGWSPVSKALYPLVTAMPSELVEHQRNENGTGIARLTAHGEAIIEAMNWL